MKTKNLHTSDQIAFINDFSIEVNLLKTQDEICSLICKSIKKIIGKGFVVVALFDEIKQVSMVRAVEGLNDKKLVNKGIKLLKKDPLSMEFPLKNIRKTDLEIYRSGKLTRLDDGLYIILSRKFPKIICGILENLLNIHFVYTIGFSYRNRDVGGLFILTDSKDKTEKNKKALEIIIKHSSAIISRIDTEKKLLQSNIKIQNTLNSIINTIGSIVELKDSYTFGHQKRVSELSTAIAKKLQMNQKKITQISIASLMHDVGKIDIPVSILTKPTPLTDLEFDMIKTHPEKGYDIVKEINFDYSIAEIILQHHERLDGSGYPSGLKSNDILFESKLIAVADVIEAMASHRPYRPALGIDKALEEIAKNKGKLYDPKIVDACIRLFKNEVFKFNY